MANALMAVGKAAKSGGKKSKISKAKVLAKKGATKGERKAAKAAVKRLTKKTKITKAKSGKGGSKTSDS